MNESNAAILADKILLSILTNNPNCIGTSNLSQAGNAAVVANGLAAFRQTLITELQKQPE